MKIFLSEDEVKGALKTGLTVHFINYYGELITGRVVGLLQQKDVNQTYCRDHTKMDNEYWGAKIFTTEDFVTSCNGRSIFTYQEDIDDMQNGRTFMVKLLQNTEELTRLRNAVEVLTKENAEYSQKVIDLTETIMRKSNFIEYQNKQNKKLASMIRQYSKETTDWLDNLENML